MGRIKNFKANEEMVGEFNLHYTKKYEGCNEFDGITIVVRISRIYQNGGTHYNNILTVVKNGVTIHTKINNWISNLVDARRNCSHMIQSAIVMLQNLSITS